MATIAPRRLRALDRYLPDELLGALALAMLGITIMALIRGHRFWGAVPTLVWLHLTTIMAALALTGFQMLRPKGGDRHRAIGYVWVGLMGATALTSFGLRGSLPYGFSYIHILSIFVLFQLPRIVSAARRHDFATHRAAIRGMVIGALLIAGVFTLPFGRMLGLWLRGMGRI